jgi:predicted transcriptional regulator
VLLCAPRPQTHIERPSSNAAAKRASFTRSFMGCYLVGTANASRRHMAATTTIKLPPKLKARVTALARKTGRSTHSFIVEAVERLASHEEKMQSFVKEALAADADIERTGEVYRAEDVHAWLERLAKGERARRPGPWRR